MKKFFSGFKDMLFRHKLLSMICLLAFIIIVILFYVFFSIVIGGGDKYGDRLDGIKEVEISDSRLDDVEKTVADNSEVESVKVRLQGKIVYFDIVFNKDTSKDKAKEIANKTLDEFDDDEKSFYDFEYVLTQNTKDKENAGFKITGTKGPKTEGISFIKS